MKYFDLNEQLQKQQQKETKLKQNMIKIEKEKFLEQKKHKFSSTTININSINKVKILKVPNFKNEMVKF